MNIKKILIITVFALIVASFSLLSVYSFPGGGIIGGASLEKGLVSHWTLNQDRYNPSINRVIDSTPYNNNGINYGAIFTEDRFNEENGAMSFNGTSNYIGELDPSSLLTTKYSVSAWFKSNSTTPLNTIFATESSSYGFQVGFLNQPNIGEISFYSGAGGNNDSLISSSNNYNNNNWHHVVFTRDGNNIYLYINGELDSSRLRVNLNLTDLSLQIGNHRNLSRHFNGLLDDIRIYNRAISEEEVNLLYNSYKTKIIAGNLNRGLVLDMPLTSNYTKSSAIGSETMTDRTPYSNDGKNNWGIVTSEGTLFNGSTHYIGNIDVKNPSILEPESITISSWIKMDTDASTARHIWFTKWYGYSNEIEANTRLPYLRLNGPGDIKSNTPITPGLWHHFVGTYDPTIGGRVYLDGVLVGTRVANGAIGHSRDFPLNIGRYYGGIYFKGMVSNALIYNRALSEKEVKSLYDKGRGIGSGIIIKPYGSQSDFAGLSCLDILEKNPSVINNNGLYWINPEGNNPFQVYCDMTTDGGGWSLILLSNMSKQYCPNVNWDNAINNVNYNGNLSIDISSFDLLMGLKYWNNLGSRMRVEVGSSPNSLSHRAYYDFSLDVINNYKLLMSNQHISIGATSPGIYSYHRNREFSTYDVDNDIHGGNCATYYNNAPWWYGACWSGNFWGGCGNGYQDGPFWTGSGSEYFNYGSIWAR